MSDSNYESFTRSRYKREEVAKAYDMRMRGLSLDRAFAWLERRAVTRYFDLLLREGRLSRTDISALDVPVGTGKLLPIWTRPEIGVAIGIDVSAVMMSLIPAGTPRKLRTAVADATALPLAAGSVDFGVCIRLLHRVPADVARSIVTAVCETTRTGAVLTYTGAPRWGRLYPWLQRILRRSDEWRLVLDSGALAQWLPAGWHVVRDRSLTYGLSRARVAYLLRDA